ncbi:PrgI family protein [Nocardioides sp. J2M5]|uniref:SCO6880 family protein n=1 Tax=Nocardioides palaemonis TaxID=2829810 RepID=UPI001BA866C7|nr:SCO6880 family protein [Nocardioides palaemonis]MBS2936971.1 PrgI family protein [Nocardioides palaemonis]
MTIYADYQRDRIGWFFGLSGGQLMFLALASLPAFWAISSGAWFSAFLFALVWLFLLGITVIPVRGRSATGWVFASSMYAVGGLLGWTSFRAKAAQGRAEDLDTPDLPGVLQGIKFHDGPPHGSQLQRVGVIHDDATKTWAVTAAVVHPGIGMKDTEERSRYGEALAGLLDVAARTEKIDEILFMIRTVPEDGAERELWVNKHRRGNAPELSEVVNSDLAVGLTQASVRTEQFVTIVVPETRIARSAKESGGGFEGRCRELYLLMAEIEAQLRGPMGMTSVRWLTSPELALASRTGFAPGDRASIVEALAMREKDPNVNADVPWALAGPSGADATVRHYSHDAWNSISATIKLPTRGVAMGALAPILTPSESGERRSFLVAFPIVSQSKADRQSGNAEWAADLAEGMNEKLGRKTRAKQRDEAHKARGLDAKLAHGNALVRPYAVCTVTVPKTLRITEFGRRLDASIRRAGFAPLRLDLAQDVGFAASTIPVGMSLTRSGDA